MEDVIEDFRQTVEDAAGRLLAISEEEASAPRAEGKWSPKEIVGHLIDSASNNHQRFVRAQFTDHLVFPAYEQEAWVRAQGYKDEPWPLLVELWRSFNLHLAHVMQNSPEAARLASRDRHNLDQIGWVKVGEGEPATLEYLMRDYVGHLKNHLRQILDGG
ncbi:MAG: DinB family protein [Acidobacteria bacterium]|nr:MAG: DinB family protein [Acidobacteriota bacterium]